MKNKSSITKRIELTGMITLMSPLLIGTTIDREAKDHGVDTYVLKDANGKPFIPGTSIAGVLRQLLPTFEGDLLFGHIATNEAQNNGLQSAIAIDDVTLEKNVTITTRDGVKIDSVLGTGETGGKYDYEAVERSASGCLHMVITLRQYHSHNEYGLDAVAIVRKIAAFFTSGAVKFGSRTTNGFGRIACPTIRMMTYDFQQPDDVVKWLRKEESQTIEMIQARKSIPAKRFIIAGDFTLRDSLIIRDRDVKKAKKNETPIHATQLKSGDDFVIPGTTVKGVLRHHAAYILRCLHKEEALLDAVMGTSKKENTTEAAKKIRQKSRFITDEVYFRNGFDVAKQARNAIDRFTGSTMDNKLFAEEPVWQQDENEVLHLRYMIDDCEAWEAGLALLLLKDIWTGRVAFGGDVAVGRGYLKGVNATITFQESETEQKQWELVGSQGTVKSGNIDELNAFANAFIRKGDK